MNKKWLKISAITGLGIFTVLGLGTLAIINSSNYEVLSYHVLFLDNEGITIQVVFGITNPTMFTIDIWNQKYDVFIAGRKTLEITANKTYRVFSDTTSSIPLDVRLKWTDFYKNSKDIGLDKQSQSIANLPITIKGRLAVKLGVIKLKRLPVSMTAPLSYFLP